MSPRGDYMSDRIIYRGQSSACTQNYTYDQRLPHLFACELKCFNQWFNSASGTLR